MQAKTYLKNALVLTVSGMVLRVLGMLYRVYLAGRLGSEGMGLYQLVLAVYFVFVSLATSGISVAATRLTAQNLARGRPAGRIMARLVTAAAIFGTLAMLAQSVLAAPAARLVLQDVRGELGLRVLALSLPFMAMAGALRGGFLACRSVRPNVTAQLVEQAVRMAVAVAALQVLESWGTAYACAAALLGNTISEAISCGIMVWFARREKALREVPLGGPSFPRREFWEIVLPVEGSRLLASGLQAAESSLLPFCLAVFLGDRATAMGQYGDLKGMALPLLFFPFSVLAALSGLLMPEITRTHARGDHAETGRLLHRMMTLTGLFSALSGVLFFLYGSGAARLVYGSDTVAGYVRVLSAATPFMYLESMVDGALKGIGEQAATFRYSMVDSALRVVGIWLLVPQLGMKGFLLLMIFSNALTCVLNLHRMLHVTRIRFRWGAWLFRPLAFALVAGSTAQTVVRGSRLSGWNGELLGAGVLCLMFGLLAWQFGGVKESWRGISAQNHHGEAQKAI